MLILNCFTLNTPTVKKTAQSAEIISIFNSCIQKAEGICTEYKNLDTASFSKVKQECTTNAGTFQLTSCNQSTYRYNCSFTFVDKKYQRTIFTTNKDKCGLYKLSQESKNQSTSDILEEVFNTDIEEESKNIILGAYKTGYLDDIQMSKEYNVILEDPVPYQITLVAPIGSNYELSIISSNSIDNTPLLIDNRNTHTKYISYQASSGNFNFKIKVKRLWGAGNFTLLVRIPTLIENEIYKDNLSFYNQEKMHKILLNADTLYKINLNDNNQADSLFTVSIYDSSLGLIELKNGNSFLTTSTGGIYYIKVDNTNTSSIQGDYKLQVTPISVTNISANTTIPKELSKGQAWYQVNLEANKPYELQVSGFVDSDAGYQLYSNTLTPIQATETVPPYFIPSSTGKYYVQLFNFSSVNRSITMNFKGLSLDTFTLNTKKAVSLDDNGSKWYSANLEQNRSYSVTKTDNISYLVYDANFRQITTSIDGSVVPYTGKYYFLLYASDMGNYDITISESTIVANNVTLGETLLYHTYSGNHSLSLFKDLTAAPKDGSTNYTPSNTFEQYSKNICIDSLCSFTKNIFTAGSLRLYREFLWLSKLDALYNASNKQQLLRDELVLSDDRKAVTDLNLQDISSVTAEKLKTFVKDRYIGESACGQLHNNGTNKLNSIELKTPSNKGYAFLSCGFIGSISANSSLFRKVILKANSIYLFTTASVTDNFNNGSLENFSSNDGVLISTKDKVWKVTTQDTSLTYTVHKSIEASAITHPSTFVIQPNTKYITTGNIDETYYIKVYNSNNNIESYFFTIVQPETLSLNKSIILTFTLTQQNKLFEIFLEQGKQYYLNLAQDGMVDVYNSQFVSQNDALTSDTFTPTVSGKYYIRVKNQSRAPDTYRFKIQEKEDLKLSAYTVNIGAYVDTMFSIYDDVWYKVRLNKQTSYSISSKYRYKIIDLEGYTPLSQTEPGVSKTFNVSTTKDYYLKVWNYPLAKGPARLKVCQSSPSCF